MTTVSDLHPVQATGKDLSRRFYITAWRWHFYAGLYVAPFMIMLAVTGLMMLWTATVFGRDGEKTYVVEPQATVAAVSLQSEAAVKEIAGPDRAVYRAAHPRAGVALPRQSGRGVLHGRR